MAKAIIRVGVAVAVGLLVYWFAGGKTRAPAAAPPKLIAAEARAADQAAPTAPVDAGPLRVPQTEAEIKLQSLEARRLPLYAELRRGLGAALAAVRPGDDDPATLEIYCASDAGSGGTTSVLGRVVRANITYYGFRHIRCYAAAPAQSLERYQLDSEASVDASGNWQSFRK